MLIIDESKRRTREEVRKKNKIYLFSWSPEISRVDFRLVISWRSDKSCECDVKCSDNNKSISLQANLIYKCTDIHRNEPADKRKMLSRCLRFTFSGTHEYIWQAVHDTRQRDVTFNTTCFWNIDKLSSWN